MEGPHAANDGFDVLVVGNCSCGGDHGGVGARGEHRRPVFDPRESHALRSEIVDRGIAKLRIATMCGFRAYDDNGFDSIGDQRGQFESARAAD